MICDKTNHYKPTSKKTPHDYSRMPICASYSTEIDALFGVGARKVFSLARSNHRLASVLAGVLMTFNHGWMGVTPMPNAIQPPLKPMRSHRAKQALLRIALKIQFLELANRILKGGDNA